MRRLSVPPRVYDKLKSRFKTLSGEDDQKFLTKYQQVYGESAYQYLVRTYRSARIGDQYFFKTSPSGQTQKRLLELIPTVMSPKERFELFEEIIDYNESKIGNDEFENWKYSHGLHKSRALSDSLSFSFDEWVRFGENRVKARIKEIGDCVVSAVNYKERYDFSEIEWLMGDDITKFCQLMENKRKEELKSSVATAISEVDALGSKWRDLKNGTVSHQRNSEMRYSFSLAGHNVHVTIFDAKERARMAAREKLNDFLGKAVGCLAVIVLIIILLLATKK